MTIPTRDYANLLTVKQFKIISDKGGSDAGSRTLFGKPVGDLDRREAYTYIRHLDSEGLRSGNSVSPLFRIPKPQEQGDHMEEYNAEYDPAEEEAAYMAWAHAFECEPFNVCCAVCGATDYAGQRELQEKGWALASAEYCPSH